MTTVKSKIYWVLDLDFTVVIFKIYWVGDWDEMVTANRRVSL